MPSTSKSKKSVTASKSKLPSRNKSLSPAKKAVISKTAARSASKRKVVQSAEGIHPTAASSLLSHADASLTLTNFATVYATVTVQSQIDNGKISRVGFAVEKNVPLARYVRVLGEMLIGMTPEEVESLSLHAMFQQLNPPHEERILVEYALSAWQDVISRLPTQDPLSGALQSLKYYNREFPKGTMLPDLED